MTHAIRRMLDEWNDRERGVLVDEAQRWLRVTKVSFFEGFARGRGFMFSVDEHWEWSKARADWYAGPPTPLRLRGLRGAPYDPMVAPYDDWRERDAERQVRMEALSREIERDEAR